MKETALVRMSYDKSEVKSSVGHSDHETLPNSPTPRIAPQLDVFLGPHPSHKFFFDPPSLLILCILGRVLSAEKLALNRNRTKRTLIRNWTMNPPMFGVKIESQMTHE